MSLSLLEQRDPAWLDVQYNNRARVADAVDILTRWAGEAAAARAALHSTGQARLDLAYGPAPSERIDVFTPRPAGSEDEAEHAEGAPVLVFIHGGWWRALSKADFSHVAPAFARAGALVMVPEYALCPAVTIEQICLQITQALAWCWRHAASFGGDPDRIVVVGHSAGAHLAAMALCCNWRTVGRDLPANLVRAALGISGVYDLAPLAHTPFLQADLRLDAAATGRLSPVRFGAPRGRLMATAGADESESFLAQNEAIRAAWGARAVPVCEAIPATNHFTVVDDFIAPGGRQHGLAWELLDSTAP
jgi:arylformamidase